MIHEKYSFAKYQLKLKDETSHTKSRHKMFIINPYMVGWYAGILVWNFKKLEAAYFKS